NNTLEVVDLNSGRDIKSIPGFREPQGIAVATDAKVVVVANGEGEGVDLLDASDYRRIKSASLGDDSDNVRYDAAAMRAYVGYGGGALAAIAVRDGSVAARVALPG